MLALSNAMTSPVLYSFGSTITILPGWRNCSTFLSTTPRNWTITTRAFAHSPSGALHAYKAGDRLFDGAVTAIESTDVALETEDGPLRVLLPTLGR